MSSRCNSQDLRGATQLKNRPVKIPQSHSLLVLIENYGICFMNNFSELEEDSGNLQSKYGNKALRHLTLQNWNSDYFFLVGQEL